MGLATLVRQAWGLALGTGPCLMSTRSLVPVFFRPLSVMIVTRQLLMSMLHPGSVARLVLPCPEYCTVDVLYSTACTT